MSIFVKSTLAPTPKTKDVKTIAYFYAIILLIFALCQLFTFEGFLALLESFWLPGGVTFAHALGGIIVIFEVFALPFLIGMRLSPLARVLSMSFGWLVPFIWLVLGFWINLTVNNISNIGFLGAVVSITPGWWVIFVCIALGILSAWASWGMWPLPAKQKPSK